MQSTLVGTTEGAVQPQTAEKRRRMRVVVAVDESEVSSYALSWAMDHLLRPSVPAELNQEPVLVTLVHVVRPFHQYINPAGPAIHSSTAVLESVRKAQEEHATEVLSRALQICRGKMAQPMVKTETLILEGEARDKICQVTEEMHVDLLVVGSRGLGMIKRKRKPLLCLSC
ncbi:universal stress protein PHOS34-like isoform X3 [Malania oleifera]|uniref:universal stress protein PHOS34-like isoform X3 n=1 Tax=Malania oleifera TaxID=397392 RepID=UPI0025AE5A27|nr:universal stress protein PHOS34-like isoform X3 [Malania oleifera]